MGNIGSSFFIESPIGLLELEASDEALTAIRFLDGGEPSPAPSGLPDILATAKNQLEQYFEGDRYRFDIPVAPAGTEFEKAVWEQLISIPYGSTVTYGQLAEQMGDSKKVRAVGRANGQNPLPIIIPCHRVIGSNNKLTGYAGGVERKRWLLQHEGALLL